MSSVTYSNYLCLEELLSLQRLTSAEAAEGPEHDEMLFIVIHQVYELWFKVLLHEFDHLQAMFAAGQATQALHTLKRILTIMKTLVGQLDILETMTPLHFTSFRGRLESASGFQSFQFREVEFVLGLRSRANLSNYAEGSPARRRLERRLAAPALWDSFLDYLRAKGHAVPPAPEVPSAEVQAILIRIYREDTDDAALCERLLDLDEGLQEWRYRHVKMVERTIGTKSGTGGSTGAAYLRTTLSVPAFPDLWAIRAAL